jgi:hypothetical protein
VPFAAEAGTSASLTGFVPLKITLLGRVSKDTTEEVLHVRSAWFCRSILPQVNAEGHGSSLADPTASPHSHPVLGLKIQLVSRADSEGLVPRFHIPHRVASVLTRRMAVRRDLPAEYGFTLGFAPSLREG